MRCRIALSLLLALVAGGCSSGGGDDGAGPTTTVEETTTTTEPPRVAAPLAGTLIAPETAARPVVSIKVDNTEAARPQAGLGQADLLYEARVEGGNSRMVAVFHSQDSELVGPIRSVRTSDGPIVAPFGGVFAFSDGVDGVVNGVRALPVKTVYEMLGGAPFIYPPGRNRPLKTFAATTRLREEAATGAAPPKAFEFRGDGEPLSGAAPAAKASFAFGQRSVVVFDFDAASNRWLRTSNGTPHTLEGGARLGFANVILQTVPYRSAGYRDSAGSVVDEAVSVGSGDAILLSGGAQLKVRWTKASTTATTQFTDAAGAPVKLATGSTWIGLVPAGIAVTIA